GELVAHGAAHYIKSGLLAGEGGHTLLEATERGIVAEHVVPHLGLGHGAAHGGRGTGDRVAPDVDQFAHASLTARWAGPQSPGPRPRGSATPSAAAFSLVRVRRPGWDIQRHSFLNPRGGRALTHPPGVVSLSTANAN